MSALPSVDTFADGLRRLGPPPEHDGPRLPAFGRMSAADLMRLDLPPIQYVVPGIIAEGLTLLAGKPKIGKSWLILSTAIAVATGGYALGSIKVEQGDVLYLALEDNRRRLQSRLRQLVPDGAPQRLAIEIEAKRLDQGLLDQLRGWIASVKNPRLIIVDVLNRVRPAQKPNEGIYDYDVRSLSELQGLAAEFGLAIIVVHHTRKAEAEDPFDCLSGSTGLPGTADATFVLARDSQGVTITGRGRDIEDVEKALKFDQSTGFWSILGEVPDVRRSVTRNKILDALSQAGRPLSPREVADLTGLTHENARQTLIRMATDGQVERAKGAKYMPPSYPPVTAVTAVTVADLDDYRRARDGESGDE